jgi:thiosulfate dehydrogenase [quinone] large subunit
MAAKLVRSRDGNIITDPPLARFLFSDTRMAGVWLVVRVLLGWSWLSSGWGKLQNPAWMESGVALKGFWERALGLTEGVPSPIKFDWYGGFLNSLYEAGAYTWFAKLIVFGEILVGLGLIVGLFVGFAAFFGGFMNWNFIMAGTASSNGLYLVVAVLLMLAWKTAGWYGLDRFALPYLGTPWPTKAPKDADSSLKAQPKGA